MLLRIPEQPSVTKQREREACADVPEDVPQSENVDVKASGESQELLPMVHEGRVHARSNTEVPAEQQWDAESARSTRNSFQTRQWRTEDSRCTQGAHEYSQQAEEKYAAQHGRAPR